MIMIKLKSPYGVETKRTLVVLQYDLLYLRSHYKWTINCFGYRDTIDIKNIQM